MSIQLRFIEMSAIFGARSRTEVVFRKELVSSANVLVSFFIIACSVGQALAGTPSVSVVQSTGERLTIPRATVKATPVYRGRLVSEMLLKASSQRVEREKFAACQKTMENYDCWRIYGDEMSKPLLKVPQSLMGLKVDLMYIILEYRVITTDLNLQKKVGNEDLVVCLNPGVPEGYWPLVNRFKPVLSKTPAASKSTPEIEALKNLACAAFANFKN